MTSSLLDEFESDGRVWFRNAISAADLLRFDEMVALQSKAGQRVRASSKSAAMQTPDGSMLSAIGKLDPCARPVRAVAFNKSQDTNWGVPWHQDRVIAVADKRDVAGFTNWTKKSDIWHCEPPQQILDQMLFVRVHLDDADDTNGAMEIAVKSHTRGIVGSTKAEAVANQHQIETCQAKRGDVLVLKMLTLHRSKPSKVPSARRVLRVDFASLDLPDPLRWSM